MYPNEIKILLLGNLGVGKTQLINTFLGNDFNSLPNSNYNFFKHINIDNHSYNLNFLDTYQQESYNSLPKSIFSNISIIIFVYDITSKQSFIDLEKWIQLSNERVNKEYVGGIIGNKTDLENKIQVTEEEARKYAEEKNMPFQLVSAKQQSQNFNDFIIELIKKLIQINPSLLEIPQQRLDHPGFRDCRPECYKC